MDGLRVARALAVVEAKRENGHVAGKIPQAVRLSRGAVAVGGVKRGACARA